MKISVMVDFTGRRLHVVDWSQEDIAEWRRKDQEARERASHPNRRAAS